VTRPNPFIEFIRKYRNDPVGFVRDVWGQEPDEWQADVLRDIADPSVRQITIRSGHGVGKSTLDAWAAVHFLLTRYPCRVVMTAATSTQLFDALLNETKAWVGRLPSDLADLLDVRSESIMLKADPNNAFLTARTARPDQPEAIAGIHAANVLIIVDEASGVPDKIFQAGAGSMSGDNATTVLTGNPVRGSGFFFDTHHALAPYWKRYHVSCLTSKRVSPDFVEQQRAQWGADSNVFRVRVLGEFPEADDNMVIPRFLVESAVGRDVEPILRAPIVWGVDPARFGSNSSTLCKRQANHVLEPVRGWRGLDTMRLAGVIKAEWDNTHPPLRPAEINVDSIGLGAGVVDRLREQGLPVTGVNVGELPAMNPMYLNLRTELWFSARDWLGKMDCSIPRDEKLIAQLPATPYDYRSDGKIFVLSKEKLPRSPDEADAFCLTFAGWAGMALHGHGPHRGTAPLRRNLGLA